MEPAIFLIGHSTRTAESFVRILEAHSVDLLVDIRTIPKSRHNPQFNKEELERTLKDHKIGYLHMKGLGGLRHPAKNSVNMGWRNDSFRGFADYMQTPEFACSVDELVLQSKEHRVAVMCAEGNPFRCHRSLVGDALLVRNVTPFHISGMVSSRVHVMTPFAKVEGTKITYP